MKNKLMIFAVLAMCLCMGAVVHADLIVNGPVEAMTNGWMNNGQPSGNYVQANLRTTWTGSDAGGDYQAHLQTNLDWTVNVANREANSYMEAGTYAPGEIITFNYAVLSNELSAHGYTCQAFIKDMNSSWGTVQHITGDLAVLGDASISMTVVIGAHVQVGLMVSGPGDTVGSATENLSVVVGPPGSAVDPLRATGGVPNGGFANPTLTTELTWVNPSTTPALTQIYLVQSDTPLDPNENAPNSAKDALDSAPLYDSCTDACESSAVSLIVDKYYAWRVVCDGNASADWIFDTINTAPIADAGPDQNAWLVSGSVDVELAGTATDDGYPVDATLGYTWTQTAGASVGTIADVANPTVTMTSAGTYTFQLVADDGLGNSEPDSVTITVYTEADDRLVAHWAFEDNLLATVGTGIDGTAAGTNPIAYVNGIAADGGPAGQALSLDGTNYVEILSSFTDPNILHYDDQITVSAWIRGNGVSFGPQYAGVVTKGDSSWRVAIDGGGSSAEFACTGVGNNDYGAISGVQAINNGNWHHVVGVYDGAQIRIYIDGVLDSAEAASDPIDKNEYGIMIGNNSQAATRRVVADIDEVRIFDKGLSSARVLAMYAADGGGNACGQNYAASDFNEDCKTDVVDLKLLAAEWLDCTDLTGVNCN